MAQVARTPDQILTFFRLFSGTRIGNRTFSGYTLQNGDLHVTPTEERTSKI
jgi:hypothetical protein